MSDTISPLPAPRRSFLPFLLGLPVAFGFILFILLGLQYRQVRALVSKTQGNIEVVPLSQDKQNSVLKRVEQFLEGQQNPDSLKRDTLILSVDDINQLMRFSPAIASDWDTYQLRISDSLLEMVNVMPAIKLKGPVAWMVKLLEKDGWLNSEMAGELIFQNGRLNINLIRAKMNGIDAPVSNFNRDNRLNPHQMASDSLAFNSSMAKLTDVKVGEGTVKLIR